MIKNDQYTVMAIDDAKDTLMLLEFDLSESGYEVLTAESGEQALSLLEELNVDLILLDMHMPEMSGLTFLETLKNSRDFKNIPVIMLSASGQEEAIVSSLENGADDYVTKPYIPSVLLARIRNSLRFMEKTKQLEQLARTDSLTGLHNRGSFKELVSSVLSQAKRKHQPISVAMLDLDYFKKVNDTYGHEAGDIALKEFADILKDCFRDYDIVGRVGGEEFAVCMPGTEIDDAYLACERCRTMLEKHAMKVEYKDYTKEFTLTVSVGVTCQNPQTMSFDELMHVADEALYNAKQSGRNQTILDENIEGDTNTMMIDDTNDSLSASNVVTSETEQGKYPGIEYEIGVNNVLGDEELFEEILVMFCQDHGKDKERIAQAIENNDYESLKSLVHTLKGVSCSIGAMSLYEYCKHLDVAINEHNSNQYNVLFSPVAEQLDIVVSGITAKLSDKL
ncbi:diguanylate cyclase [Thalassotalea sp. 1_MG-2023]|uniref:diguanylate cyclase n=1 Tax=Thalassotalea sp. 1_MG-2023 TaxID=3062680 RepID=UPI0026E3DB88|nr:diguanylate cyclase [Thalassotalea sp. 1_MG-2023]MDO6426959.1 diguanylate cyclase [Thalassotalea sp. 1_MG-2023]